MFYLTHSSQRALLTDPQAQDIKVGRLVLTFHVPATHPYVSGGANLDNAALARTNHPIPPACGIYYYEIELLGKSQKA